MAFHPTYRSIDTLAVFFFFRLMLPLAFLYKVTGQDFLPAHGCWELFPYNSTPLLCSLAVMPAHSKEPRAQGYVKWGRLWIKLLCSKNKEWVRPCLIPQEGDSSQQKTCGVHLVREEILTSWIPHRLQLLHICWIPERALLCFSINMVGTLQQDVMKMWIKNDHRYSKCLCSIHCAEHHPS